MLNHPPHIQAAIDLLAEYGVALDRASHGPFPEPEKLRAQIAAGIDVAITDPDYEQAAMIDLEH